MIPTRKSSTKKSSLFTISNRLRSPIPRLRSSNYNMVTSVTSGRAKVVNGSPNSRRALACSCRRLSSSAELLLPKYPLDGTLDATEFLTTLSLKSTVRPCGLLSAPLRHSTHRASRILTSCTSICILQKLEPLLEVAWVARSVWARCLKIVGMRRKCRTTFYRKRAFSIFYAKSRELMVWLVSSIPLLAGSICCFFRRVDLSRFLWAHGRFPRNQWTTPH